MQLVRPSIKHVDVTSDPMRAIEAAGRTCYKSEDKTGEGTAEKFVKMLLDRGHEAMIEHGNFILSVSLHLFKSIQDILERQFIRMTRDERNGNGCLISGNPRAFRDFCCHSEIDPEIQRAIAYELTKKAPLLFEYMLHDHLDIENPYYYEGFDAKLFENINSLSRSERLAHQVMSYRIVCNRGVTHEFVRHRPFSYAQESTRFCNYKGGVTFIIPCWIEGIPEGTYNVSWANKLGRVDGPLNDGDHVSKGAHRWFWSKALAERDYVRLLEDGWKPQQARDNLPIGVKTEIVVTGNLQQWVTYFKQRCTPARAPKENLINGIWYHATAPHPQMQEVANMILADARTRVPDCFYGIG